MFSARGQGDRLRADSLGTFAECGNEFSGHVDVQFEDNVVTPIRNFNQCSNTVGHDGGVVIGEQVSVWCQFSIPCNLSFEKRCFYLSMPTNPSLSITRLPASDA